MERSRPKNSYNNSRFTVAADPTTFFRILCPSSHLTAVTANINFVRRDTGARIDVHRLIPGDDDRIIETSDVLRRGPDGRVSHYSPARKALLLIHALILKSESDDDGGGGWGKDRRWAGRVTRLVVSKNNIGCLLGVGGKIMEQMRRETNTHIRIMDRDQSTPLCVSATEEIVRIFGEDTRATKAVAVITSLVKDSLLRDQDPFRGRLHSPVCFLPLDDDLMGNEQRRLVSPDFVYQSSITPVRTKQSFGTTRSNCAFDLDVDPMDDLPKLHTSEDIVFRILCPNDKVKSVLSQSDGIVKVLREDIGVDVRLADPVPGLDEQIIIVASDEGVDDDLFPAQEALLHIQNRIVDLGPDGDNIITTKLLIPNFEVGCLEGINSSLSEIQKLTSANVHIVPKELLPTGVFQDDEIIQIVGEIRAARSALVWLTTKLQSSIYRDISKPTDMLTSSVPASGHVGHATAVESNSPIRSLPDKGHQVGNTAYAAYQNMHTAGVAWQPKDTGGCTIGSFEQEKSNVKDDSKQSDQSRITTPFVAKRTLEIIIPKHAVPNLLIRSRSKLALISEISRATVCLINDQPEQSEKIVEVSGSPEKVERAQSLLQGFILSTQDVIPSSLSQPELLFSSAPMQVHSKPASEV